MIQLLFTVLTVEVTVAVGLLFKTPFRKLVIVSLDRMKRGRGPVMVKTVAGTVMVVLSSSIYSMIKIGSRSEEFGALTSTDQVLMSRHLLEASLMGYSLFLALVIDRLHNYVRELRGLRKNMEAVTKQNRLLEEAKSTDDPRARDAEIASLKEQIKKLKSAAQEKSQAVQQKDLLLGYSRLLEENKNLRNSSKTLQTQLSKIESRFLTDLPDDTGVPETN